jgi:hypothetical protein
MVKYLFESWKHYQASKTVNFPTPNPDKPVGAKRKYRFIGELTIKN